MNRFDRLIISHLLAVTTLVLVLLICVFIIFDFSENSDDFTDRGATMAMIWSDYYLNYIPEMVRLVLPIAVFVACLLIVGKMSQQVEIIALKAAGVSIYRLMLPFLIFAFACSALVSYLDGYVVPLSNKDRIEFERTYLMTRSDRMDRNKIYRQESPNTLLSVNYYAPVERIGYRVNLYTFDEYRVISTMDAGRMEWNEESGKWELYNVVERVFFDTGYERISTGRKDTTLTILPRDLARTTSDVYQLTYPEIVDYISSLERIGASEIELPKVQFYGKLMYSLSIIILTILGVSLASVKRPGGTGFILGAGLAITFMYLSLMKIIEPFGAVGSIDPFIAAAIPHGLFLIIALGILYKTPK
jgi:lipopolysaccharide export system permease protein